MENVHKLLDYCTALSTEINNRIQEKTKLHFGMEWKIDALRDAPEDSYTVAIVDFVPVQVLPFPGNAPYLCILNETNPTVLSLRKGWESTRADPTFAAMKFLNEDQMTPLLGVEATEALFFNGVVLHEISHVNEWKSLYHWQTESHGKKHGKTFRKSLALTLNAVEQGRRNVLLAQAVRHVDKLYYINEVRKRLKEASAFETTQSKLRALETKRDKQMLSLPTTLKNALRS